MKNPYKMYKMKLKTLSPVFIGSGEELNQGQYIFDGKNAKVLDEGKFADFLAKHNLIDEYANNLIRYGSNINLKRWFEEKRISQDLPLFSNVIPCRNLKDTGNKKKQYYGRNSRDNGNRNGKSLNSVETFIKNSDGLAYIPGSSIKGAIRTAVCAYAVNQNKDLFREDWLKIKQALMGDRDARKGLSRAMKMIESKCFNLIKYPDEKAKKGDVFSTLIVGDSEGIPKDKMYIMQRVDCSERKNTPMPTCLELVAPNTDITFNISIDNGVSSYFTIDKIMKALKYYSSQQIDIAEIFAESCYRPDEIDENIEPNLCLGGMSGYFSKNIIYSLAPSKTDAVSALRKYFSNVFRNHNHEKFDTKIAPHIIKAVDEGDDYPIPIGWCKLSVEKEKDVSDITDRT